MHVHVKAYPPYDKALGGRSVEIDLPEGSIVRDLVLMVQADDHFSDLSNAKSSEEMYRAVMPHRGNTLLGIGDRLYHGDHITLFPPVSGG